ncbi:uncharacterized protein LOC126798237 isoform X2 [Argentina anserina]|uniref:uncharacterized protein LOC126798237 isoform X2 n=1 Tax=Argentina anserina TaxID=57926 RepID=UPI0021766073|nr:uncharacterized protein LOC126798237 isoform X2 [Potentilla anserina]
MTLEVAEFLRRKFLKSIQDAESEISGFMFVSHFEAIKCFVEEIQIIREIKITLGSGDELYHKTVSLLYELNDALAECRVMAKECNQQNKKRFFLYQLVNYSIRKMKKRLNQMKRKFAALVEEEKMYSTLVICDQASLDGEPGSEMEDDRTSRIGGETSIVGADEQAEKIEGLLCGGASAVGIVGIAGVDKDNYESTSSIGISIVTRILDKLGAAVASGDGNGIIDHLNDSIVDEERGIEWHLARLYRLLSGKRYLIVLDDVWHISEFYSDLGCTFQGRLSYGLPKGSGGAVIVTTRKPEVAEYMVGRKNLITVKPLDTESCWRIFMETIKDNKEVLKMSTHETLDKIKNEIKDQCYGLPLAAKELAGIIPKRIREIESNRFLEEMYIPDELLQPDLDVEPAIHIPKFPVLVFVDMKNMNNKRLGEKLLDKFRYHLNKKQVFAVLEDESNTKQKVKTHNPEKVLNDIYGTFESLKRKGYGFADEIQKTMMIIIVGGDSVANWILGVISDLKLPELPSIAPIPLESISPIGGSISNNFGWTSISPDDLVKFSLLDVQYAKKMKTDSWHILIRMKTANCSTANQQIPHSLHLCRPVHEEDMQNADNFKLFGGFWNYFSLEVDALRQYENHCCHPIQRSLAKKNPINRTLSSVANIKVMKQLGQWDNLDITCGIRSILCFNLSRPRIMKKDRKEREPFPSFIDDGHLQIIGYKDVLFPLSEGSVHLAQVRGIRFEFIEGEEEDVNMTVDGAQWENIPLVTGLDDTGITVIEITHNCQVNILANLTNPYCDCQVKSIHDSSSSDILMLLKIVMRTMLKTIPNNIRSLVKQALSNFPMLMKGTLPLVKQALPTSSRSIAVLIFFFCM